MKYSLHPEAEDDLRSAARFYQEAGGLILSQALFAEFERSVSVLMRHPGLGARWRGKARRYVMKRFPYSLAYEVHGDEIRVLAVAHQSRRPEYWRGRK